MFEVGDKVRYVPNGISPRDPDTHGAYTRHEYGIGEVTGIIDAKYRPAYRVSFEDAVIGILFLESELERA